GRRGAPDPQDDGPGWAGLRPRPARPAEGGHALPGCPGLPDADLADRPRDPDPDPRGRRRRAVDLATGPIPRGAALTRPHAPARRGRGVRAADRVSAPRVPRRPAHDDLERTAQRRIDRRVPP